MKKQPKNKVLFLIPVGVILAGAVIFLCTRGNENDSVCKENVARLQALENSDISQTEEQLQALKQTTGISSGSDASDGSGSTLLSDVEIRQVFAGNVIIGDSITESIVEYGYLDTDVVVSKRGLNVGAADDQISTAIALNPSHVFMAFGSNDLEIYGSASSEFIDGSYDGIGFKCTFHPVTADVSHDTEEYGIHHESKYCKQYKHNMDNYIIGKIYYA